MGLPTVKFGDMSCRLLLQKTIRLLYWTFLHSAVKDCNAHGDERHGKLVGFGPCAAFFFNIPSLL